ncbi:hypothetical protein K2W90_00230 [Candidatus Babeliales bacterium]|nr:hypothetical protein [Candidatus Babeliales bacterium]
MKRVMLFVLCAAVGGNVFSAASSSQSSYSKKSCAQPGTRIRTHGLNHVVSSNPEKFICKTHEFLNGARYQSFKISCGHNFCKGCLIGTILQTKTWACCVCKKMLSVANKQELASYGYYVFAEGIYHSLLIQNPDSFACKTKLCFKNARYKRITLECGCKLCRGCLLASILYTRKISCFVCEVALSQKDIKCVKEHESFADVASYRAQVLASMQTAK